MHMPPGREFCLAHGIPMSASFSVEAYKSLEHCGMLARAWVHKMQYHLQAERQPATSLVGAGNSYEEPTEFTVLAATATGALAQRISKIRDLLLQ
jgi:hypothetical protein